MTDAKISAYDVLEELAGNRLKPINHVRDLRVIMAFGAQQFEVGKQAAEKNSRGLDPEPGLTADQIRAAVERGNREVLEGRGHG